MQAAGTGTQPSIVKFLKPDKTLSTKEKSHPEDPSFYNLLFKIDDHRLERESGGHIYNYSKTIGDNNNTRNKDLGGGQADHGETDLDTRT